jgi:hypothetical protein
VWVIMIHSCGAEHAIRGTMRGGCIHAISTTTRRIMEIIDMATFIPGVARDCMVRRGHSETRGELVGYGPWAVDEVQHRSIVTQARRASCRPATGQAHQVVEHKLPQPRRIFPREGVAIKTMPAVVIEAVL